MSSQLKISADTSEVKKSILDLGKSLKDLKGSKVQIFTAEDKKFMKTEFKKEAALLKAKLQENRAEIKKMVAEQQKMIEGGQLELDTRKKIIEAYKVQAKLAKQLGQAQSASKGGGGIDKAGGGMMGSIMGFARMIPGIAAAATIAYAITKTKEANDQYVKGSGNRNKLKGLGVHGENFGGSDALGRVGLTEQDMIQRRIDATSRLGRGGQSNELEMQKAGFERAFGLDGGTMTGIASSMRGQMGGQGATDATMKLQASVLAAGIEDAIGPYLESAVSLLTAINENGATNTAEMISMFAQLTKDGERTPEMMSKVFGGVDASVRGASGESSAFLQAAYARAGIGGGSIGGTKYAMQSGGLMGLSREELEKRHYNKDLLNNMQKDGQFEQFGKRTGAITSMMRSSGGMKAGQNFSDITNTDQMYSMGNLASSTLGIKDPSQAFDALLMMEKVEKKQMTQKSFDEKLKKMQEGNDPVVGRLDLINQSLSGQTEILRAIHENRAEQLGKEAVVGSNALTKVDNETVTGLKNIGGAVNSTGAVEGSGNVVSAMGRGINNGAIGSALYDMTHFLDKYELQDQMSDSSVIDHAKKMRDEGKGWQGMSDDQIEKKVKESMAKQLTAKDIGKEVSEALKAAPINNQIKINNVNGKVSDKTTN